MLLKRKNQSIFLALISVALIIFGSSCEIGTAELESIGGFTAAPTPTPIPDINYPTSIVQRWKFDGTVGSVSTAADAVTNEESTDHGTATGSTISYVSGKRDQALNISSGDDRVVVADSAGLDLATSPFSVSVWVKTDNVGKQWQGVFLKGDDPRAFSVYLNYDNVYISWKSGGSFREVDVAGTSLSSAQWYHIVYTRGLTNETVYIDGVQAYQAAFTRVMVDNNEPLYIGTNPTYPSNAFVGEIDELAFFNEELSSTQVQNIFDQF